MRLPKSFNDITIEQFQECYFLLGKAPTIDTWLMVLSSLSGKQQSYFEALPVRELKAYINKLQFLLSPNLNEKVNKYVAFKGKPFMACLDAGKMQTNQIADLKSFMVQNGLSITDTIIENADKLLACIYVPLTLKGFRYVPSRHKEVAEKFKKAKMGDVYGTLFFYSVVYKNLIQTTQDFGIENQKIVNSQLKEMEDWLAQNRTLMLGGGGR